MTIWVELGNNAAVEGYRDPQGEDPEKVQWRSVDGDRVSGWEFVDGTSLQEAFTSVVNSLDKHFGKTTEKVDGEDREVLVKPVWVDSSSEGLKALLTEHFGLKAGHARPKTWGKEFDLQNNEHLVSMRAARADSTQE